MRKKEKNYVSGAPDVVETPILGHPVKFSDASRVRMIKRRQTEGMKKMDTVTEREARSIEP